MSKVLQLKRGNTAKNNAYTGEVAELTVDTEAKALRLHDGVTAGGTVIAPGGEANIIEEIKLNNVTQTVTNKSVNLAVQTPINADNKISSMFVDDTIGGSQNTHRFVTSSDKTNWNNKQEAISDLGTIRTNASEALKQKSSLPTASLTELGKIYQYVGSSTNSYTHGYVYQCNEIMVPDSLTLSGTYGDMSKKIDKDTFLAYIKPTGDITITLTYSASDSSWKVGNNLVNHENYGISYMGTPTDGQTIIITYVATHSTNPRTFEWNRIDVQPNGVESAIFVAKYGETTYAEISQALAEGKLCYCKYGGAIDYYYYAGIDNNCHTFVSSFRTTHNLVYVYEYDDKWSYEYDVIANNPTITFKQGNDVKGTITLNQSTDQTITFDAGGSGGGQLPDYSTTSNISLESTQGDINLTSSSGGVEINASGTTTINGNEVVLNSSVASGNTAQMTISNADGISIDSGNKPFELHAGSSIDFNSENGIDINFSFNNLTNAEHHAYFSSSNFYDFSSSTVNNVELSKTLDTGDDFFEVEVAQVNKATTPSTRVSYTNFNMDTNGGIFEYNLNSSGTTAEIALSSLLDNGVATPVVTASQPTGLSNDEIATTGYVKSKVANTPSYPLVQTTVENNKVNHLVANTDSSNNIVSYQKQADGYSLTIMTLFDRLSIGTNNAGSLDNFPYEFPGTITYEVNDQMLFAPSYNGATNNGSVSEKMLGYYDGEGIFIPVIIIDASNAIYTNENKSCFWSKEVSEHTTSFKLGKKGDITHITLPATSSDPAGDAGESWFYVMKGNSNRNFSFHICDGSYWHTLSASDLHLDEDFANKITTCMYNVYLYQTGPALTSESVIAYKCLTTAQANQSSNVDRGTNIFTKPISGGNTTSTSISLDGLKNMLGGLTFWTGTQTEYDNIYTKDPNTLYIITPSS